VRKIEYDPDGNVIEPHKHEPSPFVLGEDEDERNTPSLRNEPVPKVACDDEWIRVHPDEGEEDWYQEQYGTDEDGDIRRRELVRRYREMVDLLRWLWQEVDLAENGAAQKVSNLLNAYDIDH
jgi:hypothetical protein